MTPSLRLAGNALGSRARRTALLVTAVGLSAALIAAVSCAIASVHETLEYNLRASVGAADLRVRSTRGTDFDAGALAPVEAWGAAALVAPRFEGPIPLLNPRTLDRAVAVGQGVDPARERLMRPTRLAAGRELRAAGEIVLDDLLAEELDAAVGDELTVERWGEPMSIVVVGVRETVRMGQVRRPEAHVAIETLEDITGVRGRLSSIDVRLLDGVDPSAATRPEGLPGYLDVQTTERITSGLDNNIRASKVGFVIASILAFVAAAFIILTGMTTDLVERRRELAIVRCVGGSRATLGASQMWIGGAIGAMGGAAGVPLGVALSFALALVFRDRLPAGFHVSGLGLALAATGAVCAGLLGASGPALLAARTKPLESLSARARPPRAGALGATALTGGALALAQALIVTTPNDPQVMYWAYVSAGLPLLLVGYFLLGPGAAGAASRAFGPMVERALGLPRGVAARTVRATPFRHGFTAGSLMLGLAMMVAIWTSGSAVLRDWVDAIRFPDAFAHGWMGIDEPSRMKLDRLPFVRATSAISLLRVENDAFGVRALNPLKTNFIAFEPDSFFRMTRLEWFEGDEETARRRLNEGGAVLIAREFKVAKGLGVGDAFTVEHEGRRHEFEIVGVVGSPGLDIASRYFDVGREFHEQAVHSVFGSRVDMIERFDVRDVNLVQMDLDPSVPDDVALREIRLALGGTLLVVGSGREIKEQIGAFGRRAMTVMSFVAAGAIVIACFGVGGVVAAGVDARRFEFGVLRAVGASPGLVARLVLCEIVIVAFAACVLGTALGLQHTWAVLRLYKALAGLELTLVPPVIPILAGWAVVIAFVVAAATLPAAGLARQKPRELLAAMRG